MAQAADRTKQLIIRVIRGQLAPLQEFWSDGEAFVKEVTPQIAKEASSVLQNDPEVRALASEIHRQSHHLLNFHFRQLGTYSALDTTYQQLEAKLSNSAPALVLGTLWLAYRVQQAAVTYFMSKEGLTLYGNVKNSFRGPGTKLVELIEREQVQTLSGIEARLIVLVKDAAGVALWDFSAAMMAKHIVETVREGYRKPRDELANEAEMVGDALVAQIVEKLGPVVFRAELAEAQESFNTLSNDEKTRHLANFRRDLQKIFNQVLVFVPQGFDALALAVESKLFPYPMRVGWVRAFFKRMYDGAEGSNMFEGTLTSRSIQQRHAAIKKSGKVNPVMLELARVMAMNKLVQGEREQRQLFLQQVDLVQEFHWPATLVDLRSMLAEKKPQR